MRPVVVILESAPELRGVLEEGLKRGGYVVRAADDTEKALAILRRTPTAVVVADGPEPGVLEEIQEAFPDVPTIRIGSGAFDPDSLVSAAGGPRRLRLSRPFTLGALLTTVRRATAARSEPGAER